MSLAWLLRRLLTVLYTLLVVSILVFGLTQILPADAAVTLLGENATSSQIEAMRRLIYTTAAAIDHAEHDGDPDDDGLAPDRRDRRGGDGGHGGSLRMWCWMGDVLVVLWCRGTGVRRAASVTRTAARAGRRVRSRDRERRPRPGRRRVDPARRDRDRQVLLDRELDPDSDLGDLPVTVDAIV